jgi:hypothetical protein
MLSSFRDLLQVSGFIGIPVFFTINHHLIGECKYSVVHSVSAISIRKYIFEKAFNDKERSM